MSGKVGMRWGGTAERLRAVRMMTIDGESAAKIGADLHLSERTIVRLRARAREIYGDKGCRPRFIGGWTENESKRRKR